MGGKMTHYQIKAWNAIFENNKSRTYDEPKYVNWPVRRDSEAFASLMREAKGMAAFGLFGALVQWLGRQPIAIRRAGILADDKGPMTPERFSARTRANQRDIQAAWDRLVSVGWLVAVTAESQDRPHDAPEVPAKCPPSVREVPVECPVLYSRVKDRKGKEYQEGGGSLKAATKLSMGDALQHPTPMAWDQDTRTAWEAWIETRYAQSKPPTKRALDMALAKLAEWPQGKVLNALREATVAGWTGIYEPKSNGKGSDVRGTRKHEAITESDERIDMPIYRQNAAGGFSAPASRNDD